MIRGFLKTRSVDINNIQKIIDPLFLSIIFCKVFNNYIFFNFRFFLIFLISLTVLNLHKIYDSYRIKDLKNLIPTILYISSLITISCSFFPLYKTSLTNFKLFIFFSFCFSYLFFHHFVLRLFLRYTRSKGLNTRNAVFFGNKDAFKSLINQLEKYPWIGYRFIYWFSPNQNDYKLQKYKSNDFNCNGGMNELIKATKSENIDNLFFCHNNNDEISFKNLLKELGDLCIPVTYILDWDINSVSLKKVFFGDFIGLNIWNPGNSILNEKIKRFFDLSFGLLLLFILSPILIIISISIIISSKGPVIFSQERYGLNGDSFKLLKFRTMYVSNNEKCKEIVQAKKNDSRITKIGKFLRKYSLDELPQLINVIKGEMSLVGPRPHAIQHNEYYRKLITGYMQRHSKLPGMTGLAQINGARGETSNIEMMRKRVQFDIDYNNNWSLLKDLEILFNSIFEVIKGKGF